MGYSRRTRLSTRFLPRNTRALPRNIGVCPRFGRCDHVHPAFATSLIRENLDIREDEGEQRPERMGFARRRGSRFIAARPGDGLSRISGKGIMAILRSVGVGVIVVALWAVAAFAEGVPAYTVGQPTSEEADNFPEEAGQCLAGEADGPCEASCRSDCGRACCQSCCQSCCRDRRTRSEEEPAP